MVVLLILAVGCATKEAGQEENVEVVTSATQPPLPREGMEMREGMVPPEGMMPRKGEAVGDRNFMEGGNLSLSSDVEFSSSLDTSSAIGKSTFSLNEEEYQPYTILLGDNGLVGTNRMMTSLVLEEDGDNLKITNTSDEKYNIILSGTWNGGITIESKDCDMMVTLASSTISADSTPALVLKGEHKTYIKMEGSSSLSDTENNKKKGVITSDGDVVFYGDGEVVISGNKKHGLKIDGTVDIEGGTVRINLSEVAEGNAISADDAFLMNGGSLYIRALGSVYGEESKGIKVNGREGENAKGWVEINGGYIDIESVGKGITAGFEADEDGETPETSDDPDPVMTINGGYVRIRTTGTPYEVSDDESLSPEGLEAKDRLIINGGIIEVSATDDALNAGNSIEINGGYVFALSRGDDGLDSNGTIVINDGTVVIVGAGGMGLGIDCDYDRNFTYNGGYVIGIGGGNNAPEGGDYISFSFDVSSSSFALVDEDGKVMAAFSLDRGSANSNVVVISKDLEKGKTYSVKSNVEISGDSYFNGLYLGDAKVEGGSVTYSAIADSVTSGNHYSMGGGMRMMPGGDRMPKFGK